MTLARLVTREATSQELIEVRRSPADHFCVNFVRQDEKRLILHGLEHQLADVLRLELRAALN